MKAERKFLLFCMAIVIGLAACGTNQEGIQKDANEIVNIEENEKVTETPEITVTDEPDLEATSEPIPTVSPEPTMTPEKKLTSVEKIAKSSVGDCVTFGTYEQDNDFGNGKEEIEWFVLDKKDGKALLLSKYVLSGQPYNYKYEPVTWETCSLRNWLNNDFYIEAFDEEEQKVVSISLLENPDNISTRVDAGNDTEDRVFLLSAEEVASYFFSESSQLGDICRAPMTEYAMSHGVMSDDGKDSKYCAWWWLRTPGAMVLCQDLVQIKMRDSAC